jgi:hypothetical protein
MSEKNLRIERDPSSLLYRIKWEGGGQIPDLLQGQYTSVAKAEEQIARWKSQTSRTPAVSVAPQKERK